AQFDEVMRALALQRFREFEQELGPALTHFAVQETVHHLRASGAVQWPAGTDEGTAVEELTRELAPVYGPWLAKHLAPEDVAKLTQAVAQGLAERQALTVPPADAMSLHEHPLRGALREALEVFVALRRELERPFAADLFLWRREPGKKGDLMQELDTVLQVPGWVNIWTQPIANRIDMLATGVRTQIGVKVFGPDLATI